MTADQVYIGVGLTLALAVGCQLIGGRLRIPAIIILLPVGFAAGSLTDDINPNNLLGASFQPLVSLAVAVILYDAGLGLDVARLVGHTRRVVIRLLAIGIPLTWLVATFVADPLFGMAHGAAVMFGVILVVSGPTVVGPLLGFVRPADKLRRVLTWEGSLIDPIGGLLGAVVFHAVTASSHKGIASQFAQFLISIGVGTLGGVVGTGILWLLLVKARLGPALGTSAQVASVVAIAAACDALRDDTGLIATIAMGVALANIKAFDMPARQPFFEVLVQLIIGVLFISISATVTPRSVRHMLLPVLALVAILVLVVRPAVAYLSTLRTDLTRGERGFVGWMAPRGIVAAATASTFSAALVARHVGGASKILPGTFLVIVMTVTLYGLSAAMVARRLGITRPSVTRPLLVGGEPWVVDLGRALRSSGLSVLMWAESEEHRAGIAAAGLELAPDDLIGDATGEGAEMEGVTEVLLLTDEDSFNALAAALLRGGAGGHVYRLGSPRDAAGDAAVYAGGDVLFDRHLTREAMVRRYAEGARITVDRSAGNQAEDQLLFRVRVDGQLAPTTVDAVPPALDGDTTVWLAAPRPVGAKPDGIGHD